MNASESVAPAPATPAVADSRPPRRRRRTPVVVATRPKSWSWRERIVVAVLAPLVLFVGWRVFSLGLADLWADSDPQLALHWRADDPQALIQAADQAVADKNYPLADTLAHQAIASYPLDGRGYRVIGIGKDFMGDPAAAKRLFAIALQRSPRDLIARSMLLQYAMKAGDYSDALRQIDIELRIDPDIAPMLLPRLVAASAIPSLIPEIDRLLVQRPPWRLAYLTLLARDGTDPQAIDRVFAGRGGDDPFPPPAIGFESDLLIARQIADARWGAAYFTWVSTLNEVQRTRLGNVFDGDFDFPPSNRGFDWRIPQEGTGFDILTGTSDELAAGDAALQIRFDGLPLDYRPLKQLLILGPGHYRLTGIGSAAGLDTEEGGLSWTVSCAQGDGQTLAATDPFAGDMPATPIQLDFDVPDDGCGAQWLRLDLLGSLLKGRPLHGSAAFDRLRIERLGAAAASGSASPAVAGPPSGGM